MSADAWTTCPLCGTTPKKDLGEKIAEEKNKGEITLNQLREMQTRYDKMEDDVEDCRIDWGYGKTGTKLFVNISMWCQNCKAEWEITQEAEAKPGKVD
jgi:hypothetical protein